MEERPERVIRATFEPDGTCLVKTLDDHGRVHDWRGVFVDDDMRLEPADLKEEAREWEASIEPDPWDEGLEP